MRLTLRTMLAYLDDILEPEDQAALGKKIEESPFASELVHRIRDVMRRLRLGAPQLSGKGMGLDANTVSEYLDNTMPADRVADFEKVCLESDVHLAEVGACHQILTLVLGEPADVDPASRQRMYHIPNLAQQVAGQNAAGAAATGATTADPATTKPGRNGDREESLPGTPVSTGDAQHRIDLPPRQRSGSDEKKKEVPEYLLAARRSRRRRTLLATLAVCLLIAGVVAVNPNGLRERLFPEVETAEHIPEDARNLEDLAIETGEPAVPTIPEIPSDVDAAGGTAPPFDAGGKAPPFTPESAGGEAPAFEPTPAVPVPDGGPGERPEIVPDVKVPDGPAEAPAEGAADPPEVPPLPAAAAGDPPAAAKEEPKQPQVAAVEKERLPVVPDATSKQDPAQVEGADSKSAQSPEGQQAGLFVSPMGVLLRYEPEKRQWWRLPPRSVVNAGDKVVALPTYRPTINLSGGITLQMAGGAGLVLEGMNPEGVPSIDLLYGRIVVSGGVGQAGRQLAIKAGPQRHLFTLGEADSTLAVELTRHHNPGANPEKEGATTLQVDFYAASGGMDWEYNGATEQVRAPVHWRPSGRVIPVEDDAPVLPEWIHSEKVTGGDRLASIALDEAIGQQRPAEISLLELVGRRRSEVRSLSSRSAVYVGQFEPFVKALNDPDQRASWGLHIETLRTAMDLSPSVAAKIREAFMRHAGEDGPALYRMLWGYSNADLERGADRQLVEYLDHESLAFRVLAFWNLKRITGLGMNYGPEYPQTTRTRSVQRWEQLLKDGEIRLEDGNQDPEKSASTEAETPPSAQPEKLP